MGRFRASSVPLFYFSFIFYLLSFIVLYRYVCINHAVIRRVKHLLACLYAVYPHLYSGGNKNVVNGGTRIVGELSYNRVESELTE